MTENEQKQFNSLQCLNNQFWEEFREKVKLEWRLSFGLWSTILTIIGGYFISEAKEVDFYKYRFYIAGLLIFLMVIHLWFLLWIQGKLSKIRKILYEIRVKMWELVNLPNYEYTQRKYALQVPTIYIQFGITLMLSIFFFMCISVKA